MYGSFKYFFFFGLQSLFVQCVKYYYIAKFKYYLVNRWWYWCVVPMWPFVCSSYQWWWWWWPPLHCDEDAYLTVPYSGTQCELGSIQMDAVTNGTLCRHCHQWFHVAPGSPSPCRPYCRRHQWAASGPRNRNQWIRCYRMTKNLIFNSICCTFR